MKPLFFVHIPKTGGTSLKTYFKSYPKFPLDSYIPKYQRYHEGHVPLSALKDKNLLQEILDKNDTFSVVRNPYDRFVSVVNYLVIGGFRWDPNDKKRIHEYLIRQMNVDPDIDKTQEDLMFVSQKEYIYDGETKIIKHIIKFENYDAEIKELLESHGSRYTQVHCNRSRKYFGIKDFSKEVIDTINRVYKCDFDAFGYQMMTYEEIQALP